MPSKRRLEQLRNARLVTAEQKKKRKIEETSNTTTTTQPSIHHNQLCNDDTNDTDDREGADIWFWNSSAIESCSDSEEETEAGGEQLDEEELDVGVKKPRMGEAASLRNAVKEIKWHKERENNLRRGYEKGSRSTNNRQRKATKELEKEASKTYDIRAPWQRNRDLDLILKASSGLDTSSESGIPGITPTSLLSSVPPGFISPPPPQKTRKQQQVKALQDLS